MASDKWNLEESALRTHQNERALQQLEQALSFVEECFPNISLHYTISAAYGKDGVYFTIATDEGEEKRRHYGLMDLESLNDHLSAQEPNPGFHGVDEPCDSAEDPKLIALNKRIAAAIQGKDASEVDAIVNRMYAAYYENQQEG